MESETAEKEIAKIAEDSRVKRARLAAKNKGKAKPKLNKKKKKKRAKPDHQQQQQQPKPKPKPKPKSKSKPKPKSESEPKPKSESEPEPEPKSEPEPEPEPEHSERSRLRPIEVKENEVLKTTHWRQGRFDGQKVYVNLDKMKISVEKPPDYPRKGRGRDKCGCGFCLAVLEGNTAYVAFLEERRQRHLLESPRERKQRLLDYLYEIRPEERFCIGGFHRTFALYNRLVTKSIQLRDAGVMRWPDSDAVGKSKKRRSSSSGTSGGSDRPLKRPRQEESQPAQTKE